MNSKIEKGSMNVFLMKDFKNQVSFADLRTKRKLQAIFLRKELKEMKDPEERQEYDMEREKQEQHYTSSAFLSPKMSTTLAEVPQSNYISRALMP